MKRKYPKPRKKPCLFSTCLFFLISLLSINQAIGATATINSPTSPYTDTVGSTVTFIGTASSVTGTASYSWISSKDGELGTDATITVSTLSINTHSIIFTVTDDTGTASAGPIIVTITNTAPTASITYPSSPTTFSFGSSITFVGTGSDPEDGTLSSTSLSWFSSIDGLLGTGSSLTVGGLTAGTHTITLTATDNNGATGSDTVTNIVISANASPSPTISSPTTGTSYALGETVSFVGSATDTEDGSLTGTSLSWTSNIDGLLGTGTSLGTSTLSSGNHTITLSATDSNGAIGTTTIAVSIAANVAPTAAITNPANNSTFAYKASINLMGTGTDTEDGTLSGTSLTWTSNLDGSLGTGSPLSLSTLSAGNHTITLTVTDSSNATGTATITITISENVVPTATITNPSTVLSYAYKATITFIGSGTDTEDGIMDTSSLTWISDIDGSIGTGSPLQLSTLSSGTHTITLTATDSDGSTGTDTVSITIAENNSPVATITTPATGRVYNQGDSIIFTGSAVDAEDGTLTGTSLIWSSNMDGQIGTGTTFTTSSLSKGEHTIILTAIDEDGATGTATIEITAGNNPPVATITSPKDGTSFPRNEVITFNGLGTDDEGGTLTYLWESSIDGTLSTSSYFTTDALQKGEHTITFTVTDTDGVSDSATITITAGNAIPVAKINYPANGSIYNRGVGISFNGTGTDVEDEYLSGDSLVWTSNLDGLVTTIGTGNSFSVNTLESGTHIITLTVTDSDGATNDLSSPETVTITINGMAVSPTKLTLKVYETGTLGVSGGTSPFRLFNRYTNIASATINESTGAVEITGIKKGSTSVTITDTNKITATAIITIEAQPDTDGDGVVDVNDAFPLDATETLDTDGDGIGNNSDTDDDGDGMIDAWEIIYALDPLTDDASQDEDGDGFTNLEEYKSNTDPSNSGPSKPQLYQPSDEENVLVLTPEFETHDFYDPNPDDTHAKTRWQISTSETFASIVLDVITTKDLTKLKIIDHILTASPETSDTTYYWRVRFYDNHNGFSQWSDIFSFTTPIVTNTDDQDLNGIPDAQEVDDTIDLDNDDIGDNLQGSIKTISFTAEDGRTKQIAVKLLKNVTSIEALRSISTFPDLADAPTEFPYGLINFKIGVYASGESAQVVVYFSEKIPSGAKWYKFDPENGWEDYSDYATISADRQSVTLLLKDGEYGDADGTENGTIIDPSGFAIISSEDDDGNGSDSGCFIRSLFR